MKNRITLDCERMKYPFTGLFHFCKEIGEGLVYNNMTPDELSFYVPAKYKGYFGNEYQYQIQKNSDKIFKWNLLKHKVWHCTHQASGYVPIKTSSTQKIIATVHDLNFLHDNRPKAKQLKYLKETQRLIDKVDRLVAISNFVKNDIVQNLNIKGKQIDVIHNGGASLPSKITKPHGDFNVPFFFSVGTIALKKNFHVLPALLKKNNFELIIAGITIDENYKKKILDQAQKLGVANRVRLIGPVTEEEKYWFIKNSLLFCFPSLAEGHGLPVVEAMQVGKQVLLSKCTSLPEIGGPHAIYLDSFEPDYISEIAERFLSNQFAYENKKQDLIEWSSQFDWKITARKYMDIYRELM
jgi:glycosyltransferase involved in cell wall biosynthesis